MYNKLVNYYKIKNVDKGKTDPLIVIVLVLTNMLRFVDVDHDDVSSVTHSGQKARRK
jgi:hypothetical protein